MDEPKPKKPGLVPIEIEIEDGDIVSNLERVYTAAGYYEVGCEWLVRNAPSGDETKMWVYPIVDGNPTSSMLKVPPFFKVIKKGEKKAKKDNEMYGWGPIR